MMLHLRRIGRVITPTITTLIVRSPLVLTQLVAAKIWLLLYVMRERKLGDLAVRWAG